MIVRRKFGWPSADTLSSLKFVVSLVESVDRSKRLKTTVPNDDDSDIPLLETYGKDVRTDKDEAQSADIIAAGYFNKCFFWRFLNLNILQSTRVCK